MYHLIYTSYACESFSEEALISLLAECRSKNRPLGITGMLLYLQNKFIQVLEGERQVVKEVFSKINNDKRHKKIAIVMEGDSPERLFKDWSMGFKKISEDEFEQQSGFRDIDVFFDQQHLLQNRSLVLIFLQLFYKKNNVDYPEPTRY
jgi:hypothetical protein